MLAEADPGDEIDKTLRDNLLSPAGPLFAGVPLDAPFDEKAKAEIARLMVESDSVREVAARPLPPLPIGIEERQKNSLRQMVWAMPMSPEFRFNH